MDEPLDDQIHGMLELLFDEYILSGFDPEHPFDLDTQGFPATHGWRPSPTIGFSFF
jgi:hypothetical protein